MNLKSMTLRKLLIAACLIPLNSLAATVTWTENGFSFQADDTKTEASVTSTTLSGEVVIPSTATKDGKTYTVTTVAPWFTKEKYKDITSVTIPSTVRTIATGAFGLSENITEMKVQTGNLHFMVEDGVLYNKAKTEIVYWPVKKHVGNFTIPSTITVLSGEAFSKNKTITSVTIPASVTAIINGSTIYGRSVGAFDGCDNLASVTFDPASTLSTIGSFAFDDCPNLTVVNWANSIKNINSYAFKDCERLKVPMPPYLETLGYNAFEGCNAMTEVIFPSTMKSIGSTAFNACYNMVKVVVPEECAVTVIPDNCFRMNGKLTDVQLSSKIKTIASSAFSYCYKLTAIDMPDDLQTIGPMAFYENKLLENVTFHDKLKTIGSGAFAQCVKFKEINLPQSVTSIGAAAFKAVSAETFTIPASVTTIGGAAFARTANMKEFIVAGGNNAFVTVEGVLFTKDLKTLMAYPAASVRDVPYTVPAGVVTIQEGAFTDARLTHITLPSTLETIYNGAFAYNTKLTELTIPASVTSIGKSSGEFYTMERDNIIKGTNVSSLYLLNATTAPVINPKTGTTRGYVVPNRNDNITYLPQFPTVYVKKTAYDNHVFHSANLWDLLPIAYEIPVTMPTSGLKTMGRDFDVDLSASDLKAYVAVSVAETSSARVANMESIVVANHDAGSYVPSRMGQHVRNGIAYENYVGVILKGNGSTTSTCRIGEDENAITSQTNYLVAATDASKVLKTEIKSGVPYTNLGLNSGLFKYFIADGTIAYNKCYLSLPSSMAGSYGGAAGAKAFMMNFTDSATTAISGVTTEHSNNVPHDDGYYTLQGIRVSHPQQGVYIHKGKKLIIK